ncbi:hypothetical protein GCM10009854_04180 [Saccharopolyspora halophila]|uniref:Uncharacterized protein n=1 Tax=Saccharopolyspora halophila TaxID=405551 RepID=A0ABN3FK82_9PSEU
MLAEPGAMELDAMTRHVEVVHLDVIGLRLLTGNVPEKRSPATSEEEIRRRFRDVPEDVRFLH